MLTKPRLRFDRVALELIRRLQESLRDAVPAGKTLVVTCTAPIRLSGKTATAVHEQIQNRLAKRTARLDFAATINGNQVRARLVEGGVKHIPNVIGFVHNPDPAAPDVLFTVTEALLRQLK